MSAWTRTLALPALLAACDDAPAPEPPNNALLVEVQQAEYRTWTRAPGKDMRAPSLAPHGGYVEVFINEVVAAALENKDGLGLTKWPEGATLVLEGYADPETADLVQISIMHKRHGVWRWEQYAADDLEQPRFSGRPDVCVGCHNTGQDFTRSFSLPKPVEEE
jgi:hypothetical protein